MKDMQKILKFMDLSGGDGLIQFTEFLVAGCDKRNLLTEANIKKEFEFLDYDKDKFIGPDDIEKFMYAHADKGNLENDEDSKNFHTLLSEIKKANVTLK